MNAISKGFSSFVTTFRNSKLSGKVAISCSVLLLLCICFSIPVAFFSNSTTTQEPTAKSILTPIYETSQAIALSTLTQTTILPTATFEPTSIPIPTLEATAIPLPTATLEQSVALPSNVASCVPIDTKREEGLVIGIVDGNTVNVAIGNETYQVRYIGIDTPKKDEPLYWLATGANQTIVYAKQITLVKDTTETDQFSQLLRYVFVGDTFVNYELVREGYANASASPPDVACSNYFSQAQNQAQSEQIGLWLPAPTVVVVPTVAVSSGSGGGSSNGGSSGGSSGGSGCCKICTTGKACGNSCISRNYTCHQPPGCACDG